MRSTLKCAASRACIKRRVSRRAHVNLASDLVIDCDRARAAGDDATRIAGDEADIASRNDSECGEAIDARERLRRDVGDRCCRSTGSSVTRRINGSTRVE